MEECLSIKLVYQPFMVSRQENVECQAKIRTTSVIKCDPSASSMFFGDLETTAIALKTNCTANISCTAKRQQMWDTGSSHILLTWRKPDGFSDVQDLSCHSARYPLCTERLREPDQMTSPNNCSRVLEFRKCVLQLWQSCVPMGINCSFCILGPLMLNLLTKDVVIFSCKWKWLSKLVWVGWKTKKVQQAPEASYISFDSQFWRVYCASPYLQFKLQIHHGLK